MNDFDMLYDETVKVNFEELTFFWSYSYVPDFLQTIVRGDEEIDELDLKPFKAVAKPFQYAFYCWCVEHKKL